MIGLGLNYCYKANVVGIPGNNITIYYQTSVTKNCCAPGRVDCAPGKKYLDTPEWLGDRIISTNLGQNRRPANVSHWNCHRVVNFHRRGVIAGGIIWWRCRISSYRPGLRFFGPLPASGSTGPCSGPSTLINVVGKRNLNGFNVYLRWRSERDTLDQRWSTFMVLKKAHVEPEAGKAPKKRSPE